MKKLESFLQNPLKLSVGRKLNHTVSFEDQQQQKQSEEERPSSPSMSSASEQSQSSNTALRLRKASRGIFNAIVTCVENY